jgi:hypothetical protein
MVHDTSDPNANKMAQDHHVTKPNHSDYVGYPTSKVGEKGQKIDKIKIYKLKKIKKTYKSNHCFHHNNRDNLVHYQI